MFRKTPLAPEQCTGLLLINDLGIILENGDRVGMKKKEVKICYAASSGGHFEQIMMLKPLMEKYKCFLLTERTSYNANIDGIQMYFLPQINRKEHFVIMKLIRDMFYSLYVFFKEKPDIVISTGVLAMVPICLIAKVFRRKLIFIESFAKVTTPTETGRLMYRFADQFYVQWPQMKEIYPNAIYLGGIY